jgi:hypothetical protein
MLLMILALRRKAIGNDNTKPPCGRSTTSTVSPLSLLAYLLILLLQLELPCSSIRIVV